MSLVFILIAYIDWQCVVDFFLWLIYDIILISVSIMAVTGPDPSEIRPGVCGSPCPCQTPSDSFAKNKSCMVDRGRILMLQTPCRQSIKPEASWILKKEGTPGKVWKWRKGREGRRMSYGRGGFEGRRAGKQKKGQRKQSWKNGINTNKTEYVCRRIHLRKS